LVELSPDPMLIWDLDGGIVEWNRRSEELYGYSRSEAIGQRKDQLLRTAVPRSSFEELKAKLIRDGSWTGELKQVAKDGRVLTVESTVQLDISEGRRWVLECSRVVVADRS
jgi:two-component system CheB/CheR fusion protein